MADLSKQIYEALPDEVKGDYEKVGEVYRPVAEGKLSALKGSLNDLDGKYKQTDAQLKELLAKKEQDRTAAENAALERLKKEGKVDEILADYERRSSETKTQYEARIEKLSNSIKSDKRNLAVNDFAAKLNVLDKSKKLFAKLIESRIDVDPETGKRTYLDENGGATSLDDAGFLAELEKDEAYHPLRKAEVNRGGDANGSYGGGATKKPSEYSEQERVELFRSNRAEFDRLFSNKS